MEQSSLMARYGYSGTSDNNKGPSEKRRTSLLRTLLCASSPWQYITSEKRTTSLQEIRRLTMGGIPLCSSIMISRVFRQMCLIKHPMVCPLLKVDAMPDWENSNLTSSN